MSAAALLGRRPTRPPAESVNGRRRPRRSAQDLAQKQPGALVLRPRDMPGVVVTRRLEGDQMVWDYAGAFVARLERTD